MAGQARAIKGDAIGFASGFGCLFGGLRFVYVEHRELARLYLPPMILSVLFLAGAWIAFGMTVDTVLGWIWAEPEVEAWWGALHVLWRVATLLIWIALALATLLVSAAVFTIFAAPFSDLISEQVEGILGTWTARPFSIRFIVSDLGQTIRFELARAGVKLAWLIPLFLISFIPVVGQAIYFLFGGYILSKYTGMDYIDWCAARRGWSWRQRLEFAKTHRFALAGLGTAVVLSLMIPLAFVVVWPGAVAGGAILFTSLHNDPGAGNLVGPEHVS